MTEQMITVSITLTIDGTGATQDFHFSTRGFSTKPTDTPANTVVPARVIDAGEYRRELFSGARVAGLSRPSFGSITLSNHDGALDAWMGYGVSGAPVTVRLGPFGGAFPSDFTTVFIAYAKTPTVDFASVTIPLEDRSVIFDRPIATEVFTGAEAFVVGSPTKKKPLILGDPGFVPLVLVDPVLSIYYVQSNAVDISFLSGGRIVYDGGLPLTFGGYYATIPDAIATAPAPGTFRVWANNGTSSPVGTYPNSIGPCYVRLGSPPEFDLRINALGMYLETQADTIRRWTFPDLVRRAGALDVTPSTLAPGSYPSTVGNYYIDGDQTYSDIMSDSAQATFSAYGFDRLDRFFTFDLRDPDADSGEAVVYTFTTDNAKNFRRQAVPGQEKPVRQVNVSAGRTFPGSVANGATPENRELFTREPWQLQFTVTSDAVLRAHPGAISVDVQSQGDVNASEADRLAWGVKYIQLYGGLRELITLECTQFDATTIGIELGDKVAIRMPRFLCDSGRNFRVVTQTINLKNRTVSFGLWGGSIGPSDAVLGGGSGVSTAVPRDYFLTRIPAPEMLCGIAVESIALAAIKDIPSPSVRCVVEGGSPVTGPGTPSVPDDWTSGGDPHWSNVIYLNYFAGADGAAPNTSPDLSDYSQTQSFSAVGLAAADAIFPPTSVAFSGSNSAEHVSYGTGSEGLVGSQDYTLEAIFYLDPTQTRTAGTAVALMALFGPTWAADNVALYTHHPSYPNAPTFWAYNYSTTVPLLIGTTDLAAIDAVSHLAVSRVGNDWFLGVRGQIEATATWSGSIGTSARRRFAGGSNNSTQDGITGILGAARETVGVGRYTGPYTPPAGSDASPDVLTPLETTLLLEFEGSDGATSTEDGSVYKWPVTLSGGASLSTAQAYAGSSSLYCSGSGARAVVGPCGGYNAGFGALRLAIRPISTADCVLWTQDAGTGSPIKVFMTGGKIGLAYNGLSIPLSIVASPTISTGAWTLIEVGIRRSGVVAGVPPPDSIELRINSIAYGSISWPAGAAPVNNAASITIGADYNGSSAFNGYIDAVEMTVNDLTDWL